MKEIIILCLVFQFKLIVADHICDCTTYAGTTYHDTATACVDAQATYFRNRAFCTDCTTEACCNSAGNRPWIGAGTCTYNSPTDAPTSPDPPAGSTFAVSFPYVIYIDNHNPSPDVFLTREQCQELQTAAGGSWKGDNVYSWPKGCWRKTSDNKWYYGVGSGIQKCGVEYQDGIIECYASSTPTPTSSPSYSPTNNPTVSPTIATNNPTVSPTTSPTNTPTNSPTTSEPTALPTLMPTSFQVFIQNTGHCTTSFTSAACRVAADEREEYIWGGEQNTGVFNSVDGPPFGCIVNKANNNVYFNTNTALENVVPCNVNWHCLCPTNSHAPTTAPTSTPTTQPTSAPTDSPTVNPTSFPTDHPTTNPTSSPTDSPTTNPTSQPSESPTTNPTKSPTTAAPTQETLEILSGNCGTYPNDYLSDSDCQNMAASYGENYIGSYMVADYPLGCVRLVQPNLPSSWFFNSGTPTGNTNAQCSNEMICFCRSSSCQEVLYSGPSQCQDEYKINTIEQCRELMELDPNAWRLSDGSIRGLTLQTDVTVNPIGCTIQDFPTQTDGLGNLGTVRYYFNQASGDTWETECGSNQRNCRCACHTSAPTSTSFTETPTSSPTDLLDPDTTSAPTLFPTNNPTGSPTCQEHYVLQKDDQPSSCPNTSYEHCVMANKQLRTSSLNLGTLYSGSQPAGCYMEVISTDNVIIKYNHDYASTALCTSDNQCVCPDFTCAPTSVPTATPTKTPTDAPTSPSAAPSTTPTFQPTSSPTDSPTSSVTDAPTICFTVQLGSNQCNTDTFPNNYLTSQQCQDIATQTGAVWFGVLNQDVHPLGCIFLNPTAEYLYGQNIFYNNGVNGQTNENCDYHGGDAGCLCSCVTPTTAPTQHPSNSPTVNPTSAPTQAPTISGTALLKILHVNEKCSILQLGTDIAAKTVSGTGFTSDLRTLYFYKDDEANGLPGTFHSYMWPKVKVDPSVYSGTVIDPGINVIVSVDAHGNYFVNNRAVYQTTVDQDNTYNAIGYYWPVLGLNGEEIYDCSTPAPSSHPTTMADKIGNDSPVTGTEAPTYEAATLDTSAPTLAPTYLNKIRISTRQYEGCDYLTIQLSTQHIGYFNSDGGLGSLKERAAYVAKNITAPMYTGTDWPYFIVPDYDYSFEILNNVSANVSVRTDSVLLINGNHVYQSSNDVSIESHHVFDVPTLYYALNRDGTFIDHNNGDCATSAPTADVTVQVQSGITQAPTAADQDDDNHGTVVLLTAGTMTGLLFVALSCAFCLKPGKGKQESDINNSAASFEAETLIRRSKLHKKR